MIDTDAELIADIIVNYNRNDLVDKLYLAVAERLKVLGQGYQASHFRAVARAELNSIQLPQFS